MKAPLVSILIPAFNAERWIAATIESAVKQSWERKEIIVVDDGSSDQTFAIAKHFATAGVTVVTQDNQGAAAARNKAFSLSQGDYLQWLDADDLMASDKIANQVKALGGCLSNRTLLSSAWGHFIYQPARARFSPTSLWCDLSPREWLLRSFAQNHWMQTATWLVSRELTEAAGPWDTRLLGDDDGEYFTRVILESDLVRFIPEATVFYRRGLNTLGNVGRSDRKLEAHFLSMKLRIAHLRAFEETEAVRAACLSYLQRYLIYFYPERPDIVHEMEEIAAGLGSKLAVPRLSWKYAWIQRLFGWQRAKRTQIAYNEYKSSILRSWDAALFRLKI
jgi:glycosyltransferase involved in cell wall biosynthesis